MSSSKAHSGGKISKSEMAPGPPDYFILRHLSSAARDPIGYYQKFWSEYGDIVRLHWFGPFNAYLGVHPDHAAHVLQANWSNYSKGFFYKRLSIFTGQGLFTSHGDLWKTQRRLAQPAFHTPKIEALVGVMGQTVVELCEKIEREFPLGKPFDMAEETMRLTLQIAGRALFGDDLQGERAAHFHELMNVAMAHVQHRFNPLTLPESVPTPRNQKFLRAKAQLDEWILGLARARNQSGGPRNDLLQLLVDARDEETGLGMSEQQLVDEVITLLVAGHETTADALAWAFSLLAQNPEKRALLEDEAAFLSGQAPTLSQLEKLPYALMVFEESLRLYPPIWALAREALRDDEIGNFPVAARSTVIVPPYLTHRHPEFWTQPHAFEPERFTNEAKKLRPKFAYFPFGGGPRLCIGQGFALKEGQIALAILASRFRFELAPGETLEMQPSLALRPKGGLWMVRTK